MSDAFLDADVIVRLLTNDDPHKQERAAALFGQVEKGQLRLTTPVTTIADTVYVLSSPRLYHLPRSEIAALLTPLVRLPHFKIKNRRAVLKALELYSGTHLDFGDALIAASMLGTKSQMVYSYDVDFDHVEGITRKEP